MDALYALDQAELLLLSNMQQRHLLQLGTFCCHHSVETGMSTYNSSPLHLALIVLTNWATATDG